MADKKSSVTQHALNKPTNQGVIISIIITIILAIIVSICTTYLLTPRIAFVETGRLMIGFSEAAQVEKEVKAEFDKYEAQAKLLKDSVGAQMDRMTKEYDKATPARKKELQDMLAAANQRVNNITQANMKRLQELRQGKTGSVVQKMNVFMQEYGKKNRYNIVFSTSNGGIVYGNQDRYDITDEIIKGLNERYK